MFCQGIGTQILPVFTHPVPHLSHGPCLPPAELLPPPLMQPLPKEQRNHRFPRCAGYAVRARSLLTVAHACMILQISLLHYEEKTFSVCSFAPPNITIRDFLVSAK